MKQKKMKKDIERINRQRGRRRKSWRRKGKRNKKEEKRGGITAWCYDTSSLKTCNSLGGNIYTWTRMRSVHVMAHQ